MDIIRIMKNTSNINCSFSLNLSHKNKVILSRKFNLPKGQEHLFQDKLQRASKILIKLIEDNKDLLFNVSE